MITSLDCARACYDTYYHPEKFDIWYNRDICAGVSFKKDCTIIACRGSVTIEDWLHDFELNFNDGISDLSNYIIENALIFAHRPIIYTGHSLGAVHALLLMLQMAPWKFIASVFGCPLGLNPCQNDSLKKGYVESFRNGCDPVPIIPIGYAPALKSIGQPHTLDHIRDHYIESYIASLVCENGA